MYIVCSCLGYKMYKTSTTLVQHMAKHCATHRQYLYKTSTAIVQFAHSSPRHAAAQVTILLLLPLLRNPCQALAMYNPALEPGSAMPRSAKKRPTTHAQALPSQPRTSATTAAPAPALRLLLLFLLLLLSTTAPPEAKQQHCHQDGTEQVQLLLRLLRLCCCCFCCFCCCCCYCCCCCCDNDNH